MSSISACSFPGLTLMRATVPYMKSSGCWLSLRSSLTPPRGGRKGTTGSNARCLQATLQALQVTIHLVLDEEAQEGFGEAKHPGRRCLTPAVHLGAVGRLAELEDGREAQPHR